MKKPRVLKSIILLVVVSSMPFLYNNCAKHSGGSASSASLAFKSCSEVNEISLFAKSYHPFLKNRCANCHYGGGEGPGAFASGAADVAFSSFMTVGASTINSRALDGHSSGSGPQNADALKEAEELWLEGIKFMQSCQQSLNSDLLENQDSPDRIRTRSQKIGFTKLPQDEHIQRTTITWDLADAAEVLENSENMPGDPSQQFKNSEMGDAKLRVDVGIYYTGSDVAYVLSNPRIETTQFHIHIDSLLFKLNGKAQPAQRAFFFAQRDIRAWNAQHPFHPSHPEFDGASQAVVAQRRAENYLISDSSLVITGDVRTTDVLSVSIGKIHKVDLPPMAGLPIVKITSNTGTFNAASGAFILNAEDNIPDPLSCTPYPECTRSPGSYTYFEVKVQLQLQPGQVFKEIASVDIVFGPDNNVEQECCATGPDSGGTTIRYDIFNRDYEQVDEFGVRSISNKVFFANEPGDNGVRWHLTFNPGETEQILRFRVVPDDRDEKDSVVAGVEGEIMHLRIQNISLLRFERDSSNRPLNDSVKIFIPDNDAAPMTSNTYTNMMTGGGILRDQCLRCHNSIDNRGGYDMTNYWQMVAEGVVVRGGGDLSYNSLMYQRMNPDSPIILNEGLPSMPPGTGGGDGFLPANSRLAVVQWLRFNSAHND